MAGNKELIDEIVDPIAVKQVDALTKQIDALEKSFVAAAKQALALNNATGNSTTNSGFTKNAEASTKATKVLIDNSEKIRLSEIKLQQAREKAFDSFERKLAKQNADAEKTSSAYYKLEQAYNAVNKEAKNAAVQFGLNSYQFKEASTQALGLRKRLDEIDQPLGNYGRNVGNYAGKFNSLGNSINQLTREFPAFAVSAQTGFLALSNNLPIFFDEIQKVNAEVKELQSQGKATPSVLGRLASSFLSVGTVLSVGVTLLTLYGGEIVKFVGSLFKGTEALDLFAQRQKDINDIYKESSAEAGKQITNLKILYQAATDVTNSMKGRIDAAKELKKEYPDEFGNASNLAIINGELSGTYKQLTIDIVANARAMASRNKIAELGTKQYEEDIKIQKIEIARQNELIALAKKVKAGNFDVEGGGILSGENESQINKRAAATTKASNARKKALQDEIELITKFGGGNNKIASVLGKGEAAKAEELSAKRAADNSKKLAEDAQKQQIENEKAALEDRKRQLDAEFNLEEVAAKEAEELRKKNLQDGENAANDSNNARLLLNEQYASEAMDFITKQYKDGIISAKEYEDQKAEIDKEISFSTIDSNIETAEKLIEIQKTYGKDTQSEEDKLAKLKLQRSKLVRDGVISDLKDEERERKELNAKIKDLADEAAGFVIGLVDAGFENRKNQIQEQINLVDEQSQAEIDAVNRSLVSNTEKASKIQLIEAQSEATRKQLQREQKKADIEKAKFDKAVAVAKIIENTAIAVSEYGFFTPFGLLAAALGAFQVATVLATPIPAYERGTTNAKGGASLVGEKGRELVMTPSGASFLTPGTPTIMDIPKGSTVVPHLQTARMQELNKYAGGQAIDMSEVVRAIEKNKPTNKPARVNGWLYEMKMAQGNIDRRKNYFN